LNAFVIYFLLLFAMTHLIGQPYLPFQPSIRSIFRVYLDSIHAIGK
jgi:hypothetical protein